MKRTIKLTYVILFCLLCLLFTVIFSGCSSDDDSEEGSSGGKKLKVSFHDTDLSILKGYKTTVGQAADNEITVIDSQRLYLIDKDGEILRDENGRPVKADTVSERWKALYVVHYTKDRVIDKDLNTSDYELSCYNILPTPEDETGGLDEMVINGNTCSELKESYLKENSLDVTKVQFTNKGITYVELYVNGKKIVPDDSYYDKTPDEQAVRDTLKLRRNLPNLMTGFFPGYLQMKPTVEYDENIEQWLDSRDLKNTMFLVQKIEEAYRNKEESICVIYYSMRNDECFDVTIRVANK